MTLQRNYSSDPGDAVLTGSGPSINTVETGTQSPRPTPKVEIVGIVGAVVNDRGVPNDVQVLEGGFDDIFSLYGGFKPWLGDGLASGQAGPASGYVGNLAAVAWKLTSPVGVRIMIPDLACKDATIASGTDLLVSFTRSDASNGEITIPAGTRLSDGSSYIIATLEDLFYSESETGSKTVRFRQVSDTSVSPVALNTVTTIVDTLGDANITVNTADTTVPDLIDAAELILRYQAAFDAINNDTEGQAIREISCDRTEAGILDALSAHAVASTSVGFRRRAFVSPPIGTTAANARSGHDDSVDRAGLSQSRAIYLHPHWTRPFPLDADNLVGPKYKATFATSAIVDCVRYSLEIPEQNPATHHPVLKIWGATGLESISGGSPDLGTHWRANISQRAFERSTSGVTQPTYHDALMADGVTVPTRRMRDLVADLLVMAGRPHQKKVANVTHREGCINDVIAALQNLKAAQRIENFGVSSTYNPAAKHLKLTTPIEFFGNLNNITFFIDASPGNANIIITEEAA